MSQPVLPIVAVAALAAVLWVVPSIGSQGLGAMGDQFSHVDRPLVDGSARPADLQFSLRRADAAVEAALAR